MNKKKYPSHCPKASIEILLLQSLWLTSGAHLMWCTAKNTINNNIMITFYISPLESFSVLSSRHRTYNTVLCPSTFLVSQGTAKHLAKSCFLQQFGSNLELPCTENEEKESNNPESQPITKLTIDITEGKLLQFSTALQQSLRSSSVLFINIENEYSVEAEVQKQEKFTSKQ